MNVLELLPMAQRDTAGCVPKTNMTRNGTLFVNGIRTGLSIVAVGGGVGPGGAAEEIVLGGGEEGFVVEEGDDCE